jgi:hypothetical protein
LRERERALARNFSDIDLQVVTAREWREAEVDVKGTPDDLFPVAIVRTLFSKHVQLFAWNPTAIVNVLRRHRPHLIDLNHEPFSVGCAQMLTLCNWFAPRAAIHLQTAQNIYRNIRRPSVGPKNTPSVALTRPMPVAKQRARCCGRRDSIGPWPSFLSVWTRRCLRRRRRPIGRQTSL